MERHGIHIDRDKIAEFCRRHGIRTFRLFGSILREDFRPDSDVDVLVEFAPGRAPGWIGFADLALELEQIIGREVDLRTPSDLPESIRGSVLDEAEPGVSGAVLQTFPWQQMIKMRSILIHAAGFVESCRCVGGTAALAGDDLGGA